MVILGKHKPKNPTAPLLADTYHHNMEGGKVGVLTSHEFVKAKPFPFRHNHTHCEPGLESAAGGSSQVFT